MQRLALFCHRHFPLSPAEVNSAEAFRPLDIAQFVIDVGHWPEYGNSSCIDLVVIDGHTKHFWSLLGTILGALTHSGSSVGTTKLRASRLSTYHSMNFLFSGLYFRWRARIAKEFGLRCIFRGLTVGGPRLLRRSRMTSLNSRIRCSSSIRPFI